MAHATSGAVNDQPASWARHVRRAVHGGWLLAVALCITACTLLVQSPDPSLSWRAKLNADARALEEGQAALRVGDLTLALERFGHVAARKEADIALVNAAHYGLACTRLAMVTTAAQLTEALPAWQAWLQQPPTAAKMDEDPRLLAPFVNDSLPALIASLTATPSPDPASLNSAELASLRQQLYDSMERIHKQEQEIRTLESRLNQKSTLVKGFEDQIRAFEDRVRGFEDQVRGLETQIEAIEELDRRMEQKKKGIGSP
jgi:hypothetical protein